MKYVFVFLILFIVQLGSAQEVAIRLQTSQEDHQHTCYDIELNYKGEKAALASQNYRIFYNASSLKFNETRSHLSSPSEDYVFNIVQDNHGIDASGVGTLPFEHQLGFINATVLLKDVKLDGQHLDESQGWMPVVQFCFDVLKQESKKQVVLARRNLTSSYGRAFVELSMVDQNDAVSSLPVKSYTDID